VPAGVRDRIHDAAPVAVEIADDDVQLGECKPHAGILYEGFRR
jgi:hypothetical protein